MAIKGIKFNGETITIPTEYLQDVSVDGSAITFTKPDGSIITYTGSSLDIDVLMDSLDNNYLSFTNNEQTLTEDQQGLIRRKIGAGSGSFSGDYNDLTNKPTIPYLTSQLTNDSGFITAENVPKPDLSGYITTETFTEFQQDIQDMSLGFTNMVSDVRTELVNKDTELQSKIDAKATTADLATVATSGSYNDLKDKPTIGSSYDSGNQGFSIVTSDGTEKGIYFKSEDFNSSAAGPIPNDYRTISLKGVVRTTDVAQDIAGTKNFTGSLQKNGVEVATTNDIPTVPSYVKSITEADIANWNNKSEFSGSYNDLTDKPTTFSGDYNDLTNKPTIPTKTSQLTNDMNYIESGGLDFTYISKLDVYNELTSPNITATGYLYFENENDDYWEVISNPHWWINMNSDRFGIHAYNSDIDEACMSIDYTTGDASFYNKVNSYGFNAISDRRLKENIVDYRCQKSILDLPVKEFDYKKTGTHTIGCIAQDLQEICPEIVNTDKDGYLSIQENKLVYLLLQEVKQLKAEIDKLKEV